jgi:hypothetical protein
MALVFARVQVLHCHMAVQLLPVHAVTGCKHLYVVSACDTQVDSGS